MILNPEKLPNLVWAIKYADIEFDEFKVKAINKDSERVYSKNELFGESCKNIELLNNIAEIKNCGGVNVYIKSS